MLKRSAMKVMWRRAETMSCLMTYWWSHRHLIRYCYSRCCGFGIFEVIWSYLVASLTDASRARRRLLLVAHFLCLLERRQRSTGDSAKKYLGEVFVLVTNKGQATVYLSVQSHFQNIRISTGEVANSNRVELFSTLIIFLIQKALKHRKVNFTIPQIS